MMILDLVFGFLLVLAGRNLFWLCVGIVGFLVGVHCAVALGLSNSWGAVAAAIVLGSLGVVLAIGYEWFTIMFGIGFLGGGYLLINLFSSAAQQQDPYSWLIFIVGGIVGMCLMAIAFDWTLIIISSLLGAMLIVNAFHGEQRVHEYLFIICMVIGILVQYVTFKDTKNQGQSDNLPVGRHGGSDAR